MAEKKKAKPAAAVTQPKKAQPKKVAAEPAAEEQVLGTLSAADADTKLGAPAPTPAASAQEQEPLRLPKGAFIALRQSGGLKFSTREIVVYPDGHIAYGGEDMTRKAYDRGARKLNDGQIVGLRHSLDRISFWRMPASVGKQNPDAFTYEITARVGSKANTIEVFDGSIPESLTPLLDQLRKLMPSEE